MKKILSILITLILIALPVYAADINLKWNAVPNATGYKVYRSVDQGLTWVEVVDLPETTVLLTAQPETGFVIYRVSAYNVNGEALRSWSGAWYNKDWMPPSDPSGAGIE